MMAHSSKRKGNRYEREVVADAEARGLEAERAFASDGRSLGCSEATDVLIRHPEANVMDATRVQCKRRSSIAQYLTTDDADVTVIREDRGDSLAVVPLDLFLDLLQRDSDT
jgi:Holliday junction resolvase